VGGVNLYQFIRMVIIQIVLIKVGLYDLCTVLSNMLLSGLSPYADESIGDHECGFRCNRSTTDCIFCIHQILNKIWEYNEAVHQLFVDCKGLFI
jgi:hypothetical protein